MFSCVRAPSIHLLRRYHKWVNAEGLLEACFLGVVASKLHVEEEEEEQETYGAAPAAAEPGTRRVVWDEASLAAHDAERGVDYGTMKIDQIETPFLYAPRNTVLHPSCRHSAVPHAMPH